MVHCSMGRLAASSRSLVLSALLSLVLATGGVAPCGAARTYPGGIESRGRSLAQEPAVVGRTSLTGLYQGQGGQGSKGTLRGGHYEAGYANPVALHYSRKLLAGRGGTRAQAVQHQVGVGAQNYKVHRIARRLGYSKLLENEAGGRSTIRRQDVESIDLRKGGRGSERNLQESVPGSVEESVQVQEPVVPAGPREEHLFFAWSAVIGLGAASALVFLVMFCQRCVCSRKRNKAAVVPMDGEEVADSRVAEEAQEPEEGGRRASTVLPELQEHEIPQGEFYGLFS